MSVTPELVEVFKRDGVVVIPNVLNSEEISSARNNFHETLSNEFNCDVNNLLSASSQAALKKLSSTNGAGGILDMFYFDWKLKLNEHAMIVKIIQILWDETYAKCDVEHFMHPYGPFHANHGYMYVDRVCFRLPDSLSNHNSGSKKSSIQRSLTPHLDCCPHDMYNGRKWRPIQAFVALTDTLHENDGGFEACLGLHREFEEWKQNRIPSKDSGTIPCVGQFTPIRPKEDKDIMERMQHIPCKAGDLVCWDYRIAHANSLYNNSENIREVVYLGLLPAIPLNLHYAQDQLVKYRQGILPNDQWHKCRLKQHCNYEFSELGRKLMTMEPWE